MLCILHLYRYLAHANLIIQPRSGLTYTSIREGIYTECFTIFLDWYPEHTGTMALPADGEVAYTPRAELGEASARESNRTLYCQGNNHRYGDSRYHQRDYWSTGQA